MCLMHQLICSEMYWWSDFTILLVYGNLMIKSKLNELIFFIIIYYLVIMYIFIYFIYFYINIKRYIILIMFLLYILKIIYINLQINHWKAAVKCFYRISISNYHIAVGLSHPKFFNTFGLITPNYPTFYPFKII